MTQIISTNQKLYTNMAAKDIEPKLKYISEYLTIKDYFVIPEYQRAYAWTIAHCDKLWQDIEAYLDSDNEDPYFFGTVIVDCSNVNGELHLIDGQQRTTTFLLLIKALLIRLQEVLRNFSLTEDSEALAEGLKENRNQAISILYKADVKLRTKILRDWNEATGRTILENRSINEQYRDELSTILDAKSYDEAEIRCYKIPRRQKDNKYTNFFRNFKFFYEKLRGYSESRLNSFAEGFLNKCQVIEIRSWQTEQAITMFNSLNSTGLPLSDSDIISAQMYSHAGENREKFNEEWQDIIKKSNELSLLKIIDLDAILQQYMYFHRSKTKEYISTTLEGNISVSLTTPGLRKFYINEHPEILSDPLEQCENFKKIVTIWEKIKDYQEVRLLLKFNENAKIYLALYLCRYHVDDITHEVIIEICELLMRLFAILEIVETGYSSSYFKAFLFKEAIKLVDPEIPIGVIEEEFDEHIRRYWKKDSLLDDLYEYEKNILVFLNEYLYAKNHSLVFYFKDNVNIEHIMPASGHNIDSIREDAKIDTKEEFKEIVNKLGNKILLEEDINKSIGMEWFKTKKQKSVNEKRGYKDSNFGIAKALSNYPNDIWTKDDINEKTKKAANRIIKFVLNN